MTYGRPHHHRLPRGGTLCDFCAQEKIHCLYGCTNFLYMNEKVFDRPTAWWGSCAICAEMIDAGHLSELTDRVMAQVCRRKGLTDIEREVLHKSLTRLHKGFDSHRLRTTVLTVTGDARLSG